MCSLEDGFDIPAGNCAPTVEVFQGLFAKFLAALTDDDLCFDPLSRIFRTDWEARFCDATIHGLRTVICKVRVISGPERHVARNVIALKFEVAIDPIDHFGEAANAVPYVWPALFLDENRDWNVVSHASH